MRTRSLFVTNRRRAGDGRQPGPVSVPRRRARAGACHSRRGEACKPAAKPGAAAPQPVDGGWPKAFTDAQRRDVVIYQPQVASWDRPEAHGGLLRGGATRPKGAEKPTLGHDEVRGRHAASPLDERLVQLQRAQAHRDELRHARRDADAGRRRRDRQRRSRRRSASSRSTACSPASTRARSSRRTSRA